jgi:hypothetical protein
MGAGKDAATLVAQQDFWQYSSDNQPTGLENEQVQRSSDDGHSDVAFDGLHYEYRGLVFTVDEAGVFPECSKERIAAMVDATLADPKRVREIALYGRRVWHSRVRPERAAVQALDYALGHSVAEGARYLRYVDQFFEAEPIRADAWTKELRKAYVQRKMDREPARKLLEEAGVPFKKA